MTRLLALLCGFLFVLSCVLAGLLLKRVGAESSSNVSVNTHVSVNTRSLDSARVRVRRDSADASRVDIDIWNVPETPPPSTPTISSEELEDLAHRDAERWAQERRRRQKQENLDELIERGARIASDAQAWSHKPPAFGGADEGQSIADVQFSDLGYPGFGMGYTNVRGGVFQTLEGDFSLSSNGRALVIDGENREWGNRIRVVVTGTARTDIDTRVLP